MPTSSDPRSIIRLKDTLRIPVSGSLATTRPAVTYGAASFSEWTTRGRPRRSACIGLEYTAGGALRHPAPPASRLAARADPAGRPRRGGGVRPRVVPERQVHAPRVAAHGRPR